MTGSTADIRREIAGLTDNKPANFCVGLRYSPLGNILCFPLVLSRLRQEMKEIVNERWVDESYRAREINRRSGTRNVMISS
jgi:hypothetical protein